MIQTLTVDDLPAILHLSRDMVLRHARKGEIPCIKIGREYRFHPETIDQWLKGGMGNELSRPIDQEGQGMALGMGAGLADHEADRPEDCRRGCAGGTLPKSEVAEKYLSKIIEAGRGDNKGKGIVKRSNTEGKP